MNWGRFFFVLVAAIVSVAAPQLRAQAPAAAPVAAQATPPRLIPTAELARKSLFTGPKLSPDGKRMVARFTVQGRERIGVHSFDGAPLRMLAIPAKHDLRWYRWAGNNRILISLARTTKFDGEDAEVTRLISFDVATSQAMAIGSKDEGLEGDDVLYVDPSGEWILLSFQRTIYDYPSVSRVELATNKIKQVVADQSDVWEWYADPAGVVRAGVGFGPNGWTMYYRSNDGEKFRRIGKAAYDDENASYDLIRIARGSDEGYVLSNKKTGRYALYKFNYVTKEIGDLVYGNTTNDIDEYETAEDGLTLRAAWYADERDRVTWFDADLKKHQDDLDKAMKGTPAWIVSTVPDKTAMLIWTGSSNDPGSYYLYRPAEGAMARIARVNDAVRATELAPSRYVRYTARDGLEIPAYLTLPVGRTAKGLPLVVLPHGGPYGVRDKPDFDPEVQLLANRGYAVLQPNYRGSEGYGKSFYEKGEGQWGRAMQDDLDDGVDWLAKQGTVDPKRVCMVGSSYGGYAALWAATRNPDRYRCAASFAGVSDVGRQLKYQLDFGISRRYRKDWRTKIKGSDNFDLKTVSPLYQVDRLTVPVLIAHGDDDQTVPPRQSKLYAEALVKAGKVHEFHAYPEEGHGFTSSDNLKDWLDRLEAFLKKYNPS
jgi:dipeptidyl aminopeptidase/acylaminoacyl peptidase